MRVLIVHNRGNRALPSGEDVVVSRDAIALERAGAKVTVHRAEQLTDHATLRGQATTAASLVWSRRSYKQIRQLIERHRPDVVHFHGVLPNLSASVFSAASASGAKVVQTLHNHRWLCVEGGLLRDGQFCDDCVKDRRATAAIRHRCVHNSRIKTAALVANNLVHVGSGRIQRIVDHFVAVSDYVRDRHLEGGFPKHKLSVKYNNVEVSLASDLAPADQPLRIAFIGRLDLGKGADLLPEILAQLPSGHLDIVGVGDLETVLREQLRDQGPRISFHGRLDPDQVRNVLSRASVALIPSRAAETFGLVAAEAMATQTPFVCSNRGALAELAQKSGGGIAVELGASELATAVTSVLDSAERAQALGRAGRHFAETHLSLETGGNQLLEIYDRL